MDTLTGTESTSGNQAVSLGLTPELSLLLAYAQPATRSAQERFLPDRRLNWQRFLNLAKHHGLASRIYPNLPKDLRLPGEVHTALSETARRTAIATSYLEAELCKLHCLLQEAGISCISYKGPALASVLYGQRTVREFSDLDLLIRIEDFEKIWEVLLSSRYIPEYRFPEHLLRSYLRTCTAYEFWSPNRSYHLELHWKTRFHPSLAPAFDPECLWKETERVRLGGREIETLSKVNTLLLLSMHAVKHGWEQLSWLLDIAEIGSRLTNAEWDVLWQRARATRSEKLLSLAIALCNRLLQTSFTNCIRSTDAAGIDSMAAAIVQNFETLQSESATLQLRLREGPLAKFRLLRYLLVTPGMLDYVQFPLPRGTLFLYPGIRLCRLLRDHVFHPSKRFLKKPIDSQYPQSTTR